MRGFNQPLQMVLASTSKFFIEGMQKILKDERDIETTGVASSLEGIKELLDEIKPDFLFLDNRTIKLDINHILNLIINYDLNTKLILFLNHIKFELPSPNVIYITKETDSRELIEIIKRKSLSNGVQAKEAKYTNGTKYKLTNRESKIAELITSGFTNKEIARKLSITEKTVKAHLTNIFTKLELQNRYQLMIYAKQRILDNFSEHKFSTNI